MEKSYVDKGHGSGARDIREIGRGGLETGHEPGRESQSGGRQANPGDGQTEIKRR